ncbi:hypothetical protein LOZ53_000316 [Ophidiomyces ophidiicola]|uniref:Uncharacterized protein n=1 Tax=Ophidiomyces ophidiicola TaxID=1387563 RepID=A0ACB8UUC8_9EURO|nr:hypothetical protein LOZ61_002248 [Ophidiomyces ophidiicola]KAI1926987.1 hypothetical protein LOZ64_000120 [Ophidiomyces ophidiicola]KAI1929158.1 hypothetical protein LOZ60_001809 [Ophidiomyces ophidiicola]KAI1963581.1 hypothetical protein LOZ59_001781 [Ophidiomyces ophidiicola]KAI1974097.1 hypothetical protein LOZ56_001500 [Ophidiomyces ophidiicola]
MPPNDDSRIHLFFLLGISTLLSISSIFSLVLKCGAFFARREPVNQLPPTPQGPHSVDRYADSSLALFPVHLNEASAGAVIASGALSLVVALLGITFVYISFCNGAILMSFRQRAYVLVTLQLHSLLTLGTLTYAFISHRLSDHFNPDYRTNPYDKGVFDPETWTCEFQGWYQFEDHDGKLLDRQCAFENASRWVSVPIFILSLVFSAVAAWALVAESAIIQAKIEQKNLTRVNDSEYDSPSVYSR